jgi:hypothetical protein
LDKHLAIFLDLSLNFRAQKYATTFSPILHGYQTCATFSIQNILKYVFWVVINVKNVVGMFGWIGDDSKSLVRTNWE